MNTTITRTFAAAALPLVHAQIAKAVKLATRLGAPQPLVTISDVYQAETGRSNQITGVKITKAVFDADITIAPLQYNGSTLVLILFGGLATTLGAVIALTLIINMGEWR